MKVLIVRSGEGDWEALYVDGVKAYENHSIPTEEIFRVLGIDVDYYRHPELDDPDQCNPAQEFPNVWDKKI